MKHRSRLGCKRLTLVHRGPDMLAHLNELPVEAACDGPVIPL